MTAPGRALMTSTDLLLLRIPGASRIGSHVVPLIRLPQGTVLVIAYSGAGCARTIAD